METKRLILFVVFSFSLLLLWDSWQKNQIIAPKITELENIKDNTIPSVSKNLNVDNKKNNTSFKLEETDYINVKTDLFNIAISDVGGDIRFLELLKHKGLSLIHIS